jgi:hypothetical protein
MSDNIKFKINTIEYSMWSTKNEIKIKSRIIINIPLVEETRVLKYIIIKVLNKYYKNLKNTMSS